MASPQRSIPVASNRQEEMDVQEPEAVEGRMTQLSLTTSSGSQAQKRSSPSSAADKNKKSSGGKRLVIKPVANVVTRLTDNMTMSEQQITVLSGTEPELKAHGTGNGQFGYQSYQAIRHPEHHHHHHQQPSVSHMQYPAQLQRPPASTQESQYPPHQSALESHRAFRKFPPGEPLPRYVRKLTDTITCFTDKPLSEKAHVYPGEQRMGGMLETRLIAVKVVRHTPKKMREAKNLVKLTPHVNVVSIYHADLLARSFEPRIYIVMEKCNPETLECYIKERKLAKIPFNPPQALDIGKQIIEGINHIHSNNIIHRDLKPGSVLFSLCGKFVKIIDFGMSKELKYGLSVMSLSTLPLGTDGYRAPETYNRDEIRKQADIFSLGILLYHIWSNGCHPFGRGPDIWSYNIKNHVPPDFTSLLIPDADSAADLLAEMLKINPEERISIDVVKAHPFIKQTVEDTVNKDKTLVWSGSIVQMTGERNETLENCTLSRNENEQPAEFDSFGWRLDMQYLPIFDRKKVSLPICKIPEGYLAMNKSSAKKLGGKLSEKKKMAWIDMYNDDDERIRSLMLIRPKGYDDLYGVMIDNPDEFTEKILGVKPQEKETTPMEPVEEMEHQQVKIHPASGAVEEPEFGKTISSQSAAKQFLDLPELAGEVEPIMSHGATPSRRPLEQLQFIAWWRPENEAEAEAPVSRSEENETSSNSS